MSDVENAISEKKPLLYIGYHLPDIKLKQKIFSNHVYFIDTVFNGKVDFSNSIFEKSINFTNTKFVKEVLFNKTVFVEESNFGHAKFNRRISFSDVVFKLKVDFSRSEFNGYESIFQTSYFDDEVNFEWAHIKNATFDLTEFKKFSNFYKTEFNGNTSFWGAKFKKEVNFSSSEFNGEVNFELSRFDDAAKFEDTKFIGRANFRKLFFDCPERIVMNGNLSKISLLETDIRRIQFGDHVTWTEENILPSNYKIVSWHRKSKSSRNRFKIQDERLLEKGSLEIRLEAVLNVYRDLRDNYDYNLRYEEAGQFFVREMELKRTYKVNVRGKKPLTRKKNIFWQIISISAGYHLIANYGESYIRPFIASAIILDLSTLWFWTSAFTNIGPIFDDYKIHQNLENAIIRSLSAFFPFYSFDSDTTLEDYVLSILLLPILGSFFIALKRRMERRFRY